MKQHIDHNTEDSYSGEHSDQFKKS
jgi:hypothetical protein